MRRTRSVSSIIVGGATAAAVAIGAVALAHAGRGAWRLATADVATPVAPAIAGSVAMGQVDAEAAPTARADVGPTRPHAEAIETPAGQGPPLAPRPTARVDALLGLALEPSAATGGRSSLAAVAATRLDPLEADLALWLRLRDGGGEWDALNGLLTRRPDWPGATKLRAEAEWRMPEALDPTAVRAFFAATPPTTARGARLLGEALIADGRRTEGEALILSGWREENDTHPAEEALYLARHAGLLAPHHADRLERLLLENRIGAATRLSSVLSPELRAVSEAAIALLRRERGVDAKVRRVPAALASHPGLAYARMVWREGKSKRAEAEAALREATAAARLGHPPAWAEARAVFARDAYEEGRVDDAYALAAGHGLSDGESFAELEWFAGWIALRRLDRPDAALGHFERLWGGVATPISRARAAYWAGRAAQASGATDAAAEWYDRAASVAPQTFYGQLAADRRGRPARFVETAASLGGFDPLGFETAAGWRGPDAALARAATALTRIGRRAEARAFLTALAERQSGAVGLTRSATLATRLGDAGAAIEVAAVALRRDVALWSALYPAPRAPSFRSRTSEAALLLAIARQESRFRAAARSHAGAVGLMQLMPATAKDAARRLGLPFAKEQLTGSPTYNLTLADAHVAGLVARYDGSYLLTAAAYNAGEGAVSGWITRFGDPRDPGVDPIDWIESIPYSETRNYVQRVLEGVTVYRALERPTREARPVAELRGRGAEDRR